MKIFKKFALLTIISLFIYSCKSTEVEPDFYRVKQIISSNSKGIEINKLILNYDGENLISKIQYEKDPINNIWNEIYHFEYVYNGDSILEIKSKYDASSNQWKSTNKIAYNFSNNKIVKVISYNLENPNSSFAMLNTITYKYSGSNLTELTALGIRWNLSYENNLLSQFVEYSINQYKWKKFSLCKYNYSANQLKNLYLYNYDSSGIQNTEPNSKYEYEYINGKVSKITIQVFNTSNSTWTTYKSTIYNYDENGYLFEKVQNNSEKITYLYEIGKGNFSTFKDYISELDKTPSVY